MEIRLKQGGYTVIVRTERDEPDIFAIWDYLIRPALLALGYAEDTVDSLLEGE